MNTLVNALLRTVAERPDTVVFQTENTTLSAVDFLDRVRLCSLYLRSRTAERVALIADNAIDWATVDLAAQIEGICLVPVPTFFSESQVQHVLSSACVTLVLCRTEDRVQLPEVIEPTEQPHHVPGLDRLQAYHIATTEKALLPAGTNKITFTSGSTGTPKGVCLSFEQCLTVAQSLAGAIGLKNPRHLCILPLSTLLENIGGIYMPLLTGGCSILLEPKTLGMAGSSGLDSAAFLQAITHYAPQTMILVPQLLTALDIALAQGWRPPHSLRFVAVGGGRVAPAVIARVRAAGIPVYEGYGLSETGSVVSLNTPEYDRAGTSGKVLPHVTVDCEDGELVVRGNTFLGYMNDLWSFGANAVHTGDLGSVDSDCYVTVSGRSKNVLVSSFGRNISPEWIESELMGTGLLQQVVVVGDGLPWCSALLWPVSAAISPAALQEALTTVNQTLPDYARILSWTMLEEPLSSGNGLLTANGRPRRDLINQHYSKNIAEFYQTTAESMPR